VAPDLQTELHKQRPFDSPQQEAYLNLVRTHSVLAGAFDRFFKVHGLSQATYNVLRILRGAGDDGRMCHEVAQHLVAQVPDVTRLIDRLEKGGLATRQRSSDDRRVVRVRITRQGLALLAKLDRPLLDLHAQQMAGLSEAELAELSRLLTRAREAHDLSR
jgi:DNA-binding MarR family transcriptional regulator